MFMFGCTLLFAILEMGGAPGAYTSSEGAYVLDTLSSLTIADFVSPVNWVINFVSGQTMAWMEALLSAVLFDYAIFETGDWQWIRYFFLCIGLGWLISLIIALGRGVGSSG